VRRKVFDKWHGVPEFAHISQESISLWTELWPRRGADWWDDWTSFPLSDQPKIT
jgi:hypothetical protein